MAIFNGGSFKSLRHKNYRLFFTGQLISVIGTWLQMTAMPWLVYRMTDSAFLLGLVAFLNQIFVLLLAPYAGAFADHYDKKKILTITQALGMLQALALAALTLTGTIELWHIIALASFAGLINAFDMPTRQSFLVQMVPKEDLMNAIGLNSLVFNGARLIGPAIAGLLIASVGEGLCFLVNGLSFTATITALACIVPASGGHSDNNDIPISEKFMVGIKYIRSSRKISYVLALLSVTGLTGMFPMVLMPVFVKDIYGLGASGLGLFMSAMGVGALAGTFMITSKKNSEGLNKTIITAAFGFGLTVICFAFIRFIPLTLAMIAAAGYFLVLQMGFSNTIVQLSVPDELRGRVMGFFIMAFMGFAPIGSFAAGLLAQQFSAPAAVAFGGAVTLLAALFLRKKVLSL